MGDTTMVDGEVWSCGLIVEKNDDKIKVFTDDMRLHELTLPSELSFLELGGFVKLNDDNKTVLESIPMFPTYLDDEKLVVQCIAGAPNPYLLHKKLRPKYKQKAWSPFLGLCDDPEDKFSQQSSYPMFYVELYYDPDVKGKTLWKVKKLMKLVKNPEWMVEICNAPWAREKIQLDIPCLCSSDDSDVGDDDGFDGFGSCAESGEVLEKNGPDSFAIRGHSTGQMKVGSQEIQEMVLGIEKVVEVLYEYLAKMNVTVHGLAQAGHAGSRFFDGCSDLVSITRVENAERKILFSK